MPPPDRVRAAHFRAKSGGRVDRDALLGYLERNGYHRTSAVVEAGDYAVRGGLLSLEEACTRYTLTTEEFLSWQFSIDQHGLAGLRTTRIQQYRQ